MCTHNSKAFLEEQLQSIKEQDYENWTLFANDDGSRDKILNILRVYQKNGALKNLSSAAAFNNLLKNIVSQYKDAEVVSQDWWLYIVNQLSDGQTLYDSESTIFYHQHSKSLIGSNTDITPKLKRLFKLLCGVYRDYYSKHLDAFNKINLTPTKANIRLIDDFFIKRDMGMLAQFLMLNDLGIFRQTLDDQIPLYIRSIFHKLLGVGRLKPAKCY
jgi:glycosyltransferase involved in cell wall biosynthesis